MTATSSLFAVSLDAFEGPLDLLLRLIRKHEISIFDIPIHFITERFLDTLAEMEALDIAVGGEFLAMASTLAQIKSRMLLPRQPVQGDEEAEGEDPREQLVRQLVEYQRYQQLATQLDERSRLGRDVFTRPAASEAVEGDPTLPQAPLDLFELMAAFEMVQKRLGFRERYEVGVERRSVQEELLRLARALSVVGSMTFWEVAALHEPAGLTVRSVVGLFLGLLELARIQLVQVYWAPGQGDLRIEASTSDILERALAAQTRRAED